MAEIVMGIATANSPIVVLEPELWSTYAENDKRNQDLWDTQGRHVSYQQLAESTGNRYAPLVNAERFRQASAQIQQALDRQARELSEVNPDVVMIFSYVSRDLFRLDNQPSFYVYCGESMIGKGHQLTPDTPAHVRKQVQAWGQEGHQQFKVASDFAREFVTALSAHGADPACADELPDPDQKGFGHTFTFPMMRLMGAKKFPIVPIALNAIFAPNRPVPKRCYAIGRAIQGALSEVGGNTRVAVILSGALSHFVVNEEIDGRVVRGLREDNADLLCDVPVNQLNGQNGQLRMFMTLGGIMAGRRLQWGEHLSVYRTPAGTGVGLFFARW
jgi:hypothetical protein